MHLSPLPISLLLALSLLAFPIIATPSRFTIPDWRIPFRHPRRPTLKFILGFDPRPDRQRAMQGRKWASPPAGQDLVVLLWKTFVSAKTTPLLADEKIQRKEALDWVAAHGPLLHYYLNLERVVPEGNNFNEVMNSPRLVHMRCLALLRPYIADRDEDTIWLNAPKNIQKACMGITWFQSGRVNFDVLRVSHVQDQLVKSIHVALKIPLKTQQKYFHREAPAATSPTLAMPVTLTLANEEEVCSFEDNISTILHHFHWVITNTILLRREIARYPDLIEEPNLLFRFTIHLRCLAVAMEKAMPRNGAYVSSSAFNRPSTSISLGDAMMDLFKAASGHDDTFHTEVDALSQRVHLETASTKVKGINTLNKLLIAKGAPPLVGTMKKDYESFFHLSALLNQSTEKVMKGHKGQLKSSEDMREFLTSPWTLMRLAKKTK